MKIGFFGTPDIGAFCLRELARRFEVLFTVTGEDKPAGRHRHLQASPVKVSALELGVPVLQPAKLRDEGFIAELKKYPADAYVIVAYGKIIPREIFDHPPLKTINLHPSLLPKYRGAAPVEWALMRGEMETGITVQLINERLDEGDILAQKTHDRGGAVRYRPPGRRGAPCRYAAADGGGRYHPAKTTRG